MFKITLSKSFQTMIVFIDLDGTLIDTASRKYKSFKDGLSDFTIDEIPVFPDALKFINDCKKKGHTFIILSDSHPKYVSKISKGIFNIEYIFLADKPNTARIMEFINSRSELKESFSNKKNFLIVGDSALDIQLGRKLRIPTVLTRFYNLNGDFDEADLIKDERFLIKSGPTFIIKSFEELSSIIENKENTLLSIESAYQNIHSDKAIRFWDYRNRDRFVAFRCLARQENGICDEYARADLYYQIDNPNRTREVLELLATGTSNFLSKVSTGSFKWDYITYVTDKKTTIPQNKMKEIFDLIKTDIPKIEVFEWESNINTSLRAEKDYKRRQEYLNRNLKIKKELVLQNKNIIIVDDQLTTGATAFAIRRKLEEENVGNILFITLFYMILEVKDNKICPKCGKPLTIKTNRKEGTKFYSCVSERYGGTGCGYIENIK